MLSLSVQATIAEVIYKWKTRGIPDNTQIEKMREEFKSYHYQPQDKYSFPVEEVANKAVKIESFAS
jgi:hypothetical protein